MFINVYLYTLSKNGQIDKNKNLNECKTKMVTKFNKIKKNKEH